MTSKENIERIDNAIKEHLSEQCYMIWNSIKKDLEELERYRKIMCKPIVELMKDMEVLELIKNKSFIGREIISGQETLNIVLLINDSNRKIIEEWVEK